MGRPSAVEVELLPLSRRQLLALGGAAAVVPAARGATITGAPWAAPVDDPVADTYHRVLLAHTRWVQRQWDPVIGAYSGSDFRFAAVLGNAVLLTTEGYDAESAGVTRATLRERTLATIRRFAASNRLAGGAEWGRQLFPDATFELYVVLAARLLWEDLDGATRANVDRIASGRAAYAYGLDLRDDPLSSGWSAHAPAGGWIGDTALAGMGVYAEAIAPGLAWARDEPPGWRDRLLFWATNMSGLPAADRANPARVDGLPVRERAVAHNLHDTFVVESQGSADPHHQADLWRTAGRTAICFLAAGKPLPQVLTRQPSGRQLWRTLRLLASDAGEPVLPMVADGYHRYGRDVLPLAFLAQVQGDTHAARAEADLAARLMPALRYDPESRLTAFGGHDGDEAEARAELAVAYLFHRRRGTPVRPVTPAAFFAAAAGTRDFGPQVAMTVHQSPHAFAAAVTKPGFTRFLWQPGHDNWLIDTRAAGFLPASSHAPTGVWTRAYRADADGLDATATVLSYGEDHAGFVTLPTGTVVYASSGVGPDEGVLTLFNLDVPGIPGLTGERTFTGAGGATTLSGRGGGGGDGGTDELTFTPCPARYVRMLGRAAATGYGYSMWTFAVLDDAGADLAQGAMPTASSSDVTYPARNATDGNPQTRWAVDRTERGRADSWLAVDLGSVVTVAGARLTWEAGYGTRYVIQTSTDALTWTDAVAVPDARTLRGRWVDIDGRAGLVTHGGDRPITVTATGVIAAAGEAAGVTVEGYAPGRVDLAAAARRRMPVAPAGLRASDADGFLTVLNLTPRAVRGEVVTVPSRDRLYRGTQTVRDDGLRWPVTLDGGTALVEPPRFTVDGTPPAGTRFTVTDSHHVTVTAPASHAVSVRLRAGRWTTAVRLAPGRSRTFTAGDHRPLTPTPDLARGRTTFPTSPLPADMTSPANAVDGDGRTTWRPGTSGRMVVDLGDAHDVTTVRLAWTGGRRRPLRLERSTDGLTYTTVARLTRPPRIAVSRVSTSARYVAVVVDGWRPGDAELLDFAVLGTD